jgi:tetratricopeptide (TPR) repeat protein
MAAYGYQSSTVAFDRARIAAYRALALDPHSAESHAAVGLFELWMGWDMEVARRELRRASEADPSWAVPVCWLGQLAVALGRDEEALAAVSRARKLEPLSPVTAFIAAGVLVWSRSFRRRRRRSKACD